MAVVFGEVASGATRVPPQGWLYRICREGGTGARLHNRARHQRRAPTCMCRSPTANRLRRVNRHGIRKVSVAERKQGQSTPGMTRSEAIVVDDIWSGTAVTEPGAVSGWHHHGAHDTIVYVARGAFD